MLNNKVIKAHFYVCASEFWGPAEMRGNDFEKSKVEIMK